MLDAAATRILNALTGAVIRCLRRQESIAVATSGGLDSGILAALAAKHFDETVHLVTVAVPGAVDSSRARLLARHLGAPLSEVVLHPDRVREALPHFVPLLGAQRVDAALAKEWGVAADSRFVSPVMAAWELPLYFAMEESRRFASRLMVGQGADEAFGGYRRYLDLPPGSVRAAMAEDQKRLTEEVLPAEARMSERGGVDVRYPFLDPVVQKVARDLPLERLITGGDRKRILREVARHLELPPEVSEAPKTAAQYGSGVAGILASLAEQAGLHQNEFLTGFLVQRTMGELHSLRT